MFKKALSMLLCLMPGILYGQYDRYVERALMTGFGYHAADPAAEKWIGRPVPEFRFETPEGGVFTPESLKGRVVVMDFWATWCGWCKRMTEDIETTLTKYPAGKVQLLGVTYKENNEQEGLKYWEEKGYSFPMTLNNPEPGTSLKAGHPSVVVIDQNGIVRGYKSGWSPTAAQEFDLLVGYLLGEVEISVEAAAASLACGDYLKTMVIVDALIGADPGAEKMVWKTRLEALRGMNNPNFVGYLDYLKEKYAGDREIMPLLGQEKDPETLLIRNVNVVDVNSGRILPYQNIYIIDGTIYAVSQFAGTNKADETIDGKGAYVVPGLMDAHIHIANGLRMKIETIYPHLEYLVRHGITSIRDAAGDAPILGRLKKETEAGLIAGPDIYYAAFVAGPKYFYRGGSDIPGGVNGEEFSPWNQCLRPGDDLDKAMQDAAGCGAAGIKVYSAMSKEFFAEVAAAAKRHGLKVWGHAALFPAKPTDVAEAGMEVVSHVYMLEWENVKEQLVDEILANYHRHYKTIDRGNINVAAFCEAMKKNDAILDPTLCVSMFPQTPPAMPWILKVLADVYKNGVKIAAGTDTVNLLDREYPYLYTELDLYVNECGFSPIDALRSATIIAAETVGAENLIGSVDVGKKADLLLVEGNPLEDINNLKNRVAVIKNGKIIK